MLIQLGNIVAGFVLASPKIKTWFKNPEAGTQMGTVETRLNNFRGSIGIIELVLGVLVILQSFGGGYNSFLGHGLLQGVAAVLMGLILGANFFQKFPAIRDIIPKVQAYSEWIGVAGIVVGVLGLI
ncbi:MAG TPA: hypothetical protein VJH94_02390 [Candidatus Paceibacterota bacterium]